MSSECCSLRCGIDKITRPEQQSNVSAPSHQLEMLLQKLPQIFCYDTAINRPITSFRTPVSSTPRPFDLISARPKLSTSTTSPPAKKDFEMSGNSPNKASGTIGDTGPSSVDCLDSGCPRGHLGEDIAEDVNFCPTKTSWKAINQAFENSWAVTLRQLAETNPARLDLTQVPMTQRDSSQLGDLHLKVFNSYHRHTTFELDMIHCTNGCFTNSQKCGVVDIAKMGTSEASGKLREKDDITKPVFYPTMLLPGSSHKTSIQKLAVRLMLNDYENNLPDPEDSGTLGRRERTWMKRSLENISSFSELVSLDLDITFDHDSPKTLEWDEEGNCLWKDYQQSLTYFLDRLHKLQRLRVTIIGTSTTLIKWLEERYGLAPAIHKHDQNCHHFKFPSVVAENTPETTVYEWKSQTRDRPLEFESDEQEEDDWDDGGAWDVDQIEIILPEGTDMGDEMSFEEIVERTELELFGPGGVNGDREYDSDDEISMI